MSVPYKCPVCDGKGHLVKIPDAGTAVLTVKEKCHACDGKCIVWSPDVSVPCHPYPVYEPPYWVPPGHPPYGPRWYVATTDPREVSMWLTPRTACGKATSSAST